MNSPNSETSQFNKQTEADNVVIIGAGQAAMQLCISLRQNGYIGGITLIGNESRPPYQRPPLSKEFLKGVIEEEDLDFRPKRYFAENNIECHFADPAVKVDREKQKVELASGKTLQYTHLVFATGARNRVPPVPGFDRADIAGLRTCEDAIDLSERLKPGQSVAVIGAGFIGLEFASAAVEKGCLVTVVEATGRAMSRSLSSETGHYLVAKLAERGVTFHFELLVSGVILRRGKVAGIRAGEIEIQADFVLLSAGVTANTELARDCGLVCGRGVEVDCTLRTSDPNISAIGDCASFPSRRSGERLLLESVQNATGQARYLAAWLAGKPVAAEYDDVPWFWSEIAGCKLQIAGAGVGADHSVLRGNQESARFSVYRFAKDRLVAVESINAPAEHMLGRKLIAKSQIVTPEQVKDTSFDLKTLLNR